MNKNDEQLQKQTVSPRGVVFAHGDIAAVVDDFYTRIQHDPILSVPFQSVHDWPDHVDRLTHFWWIRFGGQPYMFSQYNPVGKHFFAGFNRELLARWLGLFHETIKKHLNESQADFWTLISEKMGDSLAMRNDALKQEHERASKPE